MSRVDSVWAGGWGTGVTIRHFLPSHADDPDVVRQYAKLERLGGQRAVNASHLFTVKV